MAVQSGVECNVVYAVESTIGTPPSGGGTSQTIRRVSVNINPTAASFQSNESAAHQQIADLRLGTKGTSGTIDGELSNSTYDAFFEAVMRGTWTAGSTTGSMSLSVAAGVITRASGSFITDGFKLGDIVRATGFATTGAVNNGVNYRITALTALLMTAIDDSGAAPADVGAAVGVTVAVQGSKLLIGTTKRSFSIEEVLPTSDFSFRHNGCRLGSLALRIPPNAMSTVSFGVMGISTTTLSSSSSPYYTAAVAETTTNLFAGPSGVVRINGADTLLATGLEFNVSNNLSTVQPIGTKLVPDIFYGSTVVTGSFSAIMDSVTYADAFLNETEVGVQCVLDTVDATPASFFSIYAQRVKLMNVQKQLTASGAVIATYQFQALRKIGGAATVYDTSSLVMQRSN